MSPQPGVRLGNYEVLSDLGHGGMGEVYKTRDLKLEREVAIKVLPHKMASDSPRLRRFEQEARAASALNHPNIVTIYEIGEHEEHAVHCDGVCGRRLAPRDVGRRPTPQRQAHEHEEVGYEL